MVSMPINQERQIAIQAVIEATQLCQQVRAQLNQTERMLKEDRSPVTVADFGAQALILDRLHLAFPDIPVVAEEDAADLLEPQQAVIRERVVNHVRAIRADLDEPAIIAAINRGNYSGGKSGRYWTLDPIDGTKGFLRNDQYAVALALIEEGQVILGVLGCPSLPIEGVEPTGAVGGCLLVAEKGQGAQLLSMQGECIRTVRVTGVSDPVEAIICESVESGHSRHDHTARIAQVLRINRPSIRMDSQCKYATVARADASIYLRLPTRPGYEEKIWDHAAGAIVVEEAGGKVTDMHGKPLNFSMGRTLKNNQGVVATNGLLHNAVIAAIADESF